MIMAFEFSISITTYMFDKSESISASYGHDRSLWIHTRGIRQHASIIDVKVFEAMHPSERVGGTTVKPFTEWTGGKGVNCDKAKP